MYIYIYIYTHIYTHIHAHRSFSTTFDKGLRKNNNNKETDIGKHKLNEHWI